MTKPFFLLTLTLILLTASCNETISSKEKAKQTDVQTSTEEVDLEDLILDSLKKMSFDTNTYNGKLDYIRNLVAMELFPMEVNDDTLFDLNFDGIDDLVFSYYAQAGTGRKEGMFVYLNKGTKNIFEKDSLLSSIRNPSFFLKKKKITGYYLAHGGGECIELKFFNKKWNISKLVSVDNHEENSRWICTFPEKNSSKTYNLPYDYIPPSEIIEVEKKHLKD